MLIEQDKTPNSIPRATLFATYYTKANKSPSETKTAGSVLGYYDVNKNQKFQSLKHTPLNLSQCQSGFSLTASGPQKSETPHALVAI